MQAANFGARIRRPTSRLNGVGSRAASLLCLLVLLSSLGCSPADPPAAETMIPSTEVETSASTEGTETAAPFVEEDVRAAIAVFGNDVEIAPGAAVSAEYHTDFGTTPIGQPIVHAFILRNHGRIPLTLDALSLPEGFEFAFPPDSIILPAADIPLYVRMSADSAGIHAGDVRIETREETVAPFAFPIRGMTLGPASFLVLGNGHLIADGLLDLKTSNHTFFLNDTDGSVGQPVVAIAINAGGALTYSVQSGSGITFGHVSSNAPGLDDSFDPANLPAGLTANLAASANVPANASITRTFTIRNDSDRPLTLDRIVIPDGFILLAEPATTLAPGEDTDFQVQLDTSTLGIKVGEITIASDRAIEAPFTFTVMGIVGSTWGSSPPPLSAEDDPLPPAPRINVFGDNRNIFNRSTAPTPDDLTDFGVVFPGSAPVIHTFAIRNTGTLPLTLEPVTVPDGFTLVNQPISPVAPGETAHFQVRMDSAVSGTKSGLIAFRHNATNLDPFTFAIRGVVREPSPVIAMSADDADSPDGTIPGSALYTDFGSVPLGGTPIARWFTLRNDGELPLTIGSVALPEGFTLADAPADTLLPGESSRFRIRLDADTMGDKTGVVRIGSNDPNQSLLAHSIQGIVTEARPILSVQRGLGESMSASGTRVTTQTHVHIASQILWQQPAHTSSFVIHNDGSSPLQLESVSVPDGFILTRSPADVIPPGGWTRFDVQIDNSVEGSPSGWISIVSNDSTRNPFTFSISGNVVAAPAPSVVSVLGNLRYISNLSSMPRDEDHTNFGTHAAADGEASAIARTFTIRNDGAFPLHLGAVHVPAGFILASEPASLLQPGASTRFEVQLDTSLAGTHAGAVFFIHDGRGLNPFAFRIQGTVAP